MMNTDQLYRAKREYSGKTVLVTGGFGFKGTWLAALLSVLGAKVVVAGLKNPDRDLSETFDYNSARIDTKTLDIRSGLFQVLVLKTQPDYVFHLAAQPIVLEGFKNPLATFSTNVMGTASVLEAVRQIEKPVSIICVTTDKVYRDVGKTTGYVESDELRGLDPYSSSKSCCELVAFSYRSSFFAGTNKTLSTCRAGNVLGGGDYSADRIVPDLVRGIKAGTPVIIRNPKSIRPYEHVLDALWAYVLLGFEQAVDPSLAGEYNIGPNDDCLMTTGEIADYAALNYGAEVITKSVEGAPHETEVLTLDSSLFRKTFNWSPRYSTKEEILRETFEWHNLVETNSATSVVLSQIRRFLDD